MRQSGVNAKHARSKIDMAAAVAILEQALAIEKAKDA
jgi:RNase H-fold protein (predicted Holliday junction resolvase)